jgi:hypothetical protein
MISPSWSRDLGAGLRMRAVAGPADVERVAAFDALIHGAGSEPTWRTWMTVHPHVDRAVWLLVEEQATARVVASLCLLPWQLKYGGVTLHSAEMGVVGTLEQYRGRGLQHALNARFNELLRIGGYDLSHIQGIPYFYRQFGYEYALPLEAWWRIETHMLPAAPPAGHSCRPATLADLPILARGYDEAAAALDIAALRDEATWRYLLGPALETETAAEVWLVCDPTGTPMGYFRVARQGFGDGLIVAEASLLSPDAALTALAELRRLTLERAKPFARLNLPAETPLVVVGRSLGAYDGGAYGWQIRLPDPLALLGKLAPVFERRVAASIYAGLSRDLVIDLYRQSLCMRFVDGRLAAVEAAAPDAPADLRLPPQLLAPLLLGHRSLDEIAPMYPDAFTPGQARPLIDTLFPKLRTWLYQPY